MLYKNFDYDKIPNRSTIFPALYGGLPKSNS